MSGASADVNYSTATTVTSRSTKTAIIYDVVVVIVVATIIT